jgi:hypothetical protein
MDKKIIDDAIASYNLSDSYLKQLVSDYSNFQILDYSNKEEVENAKKKMREFSKIRTSIDAKRKELKAVALEYGRAVDGEAARLTDIIVPLEMHYKSEIVKAEQWEQQQEEERRNKILQTYLDNGFNKHFITSTLFIGDFSVDIDEDFFKLKTQMHEMLISQGVKAGEEFQRKLEEEEKLRKEQEEKDRILREKELELQRKQEELEQKMRAFEKAQQEAEQKKEETKIVEQPKVEEVPQQQKEEETKRLLGLDMGKSFEYYSPLLDCQLYLSTCFDNENQPFWVVSKNKLSRAFNYYSELDEETEIYDASGMGWQIAMDDFENKMLERENSLDTNDEN